MQAHAILDYVYVNGVPFGDTCHASVTSVSVPCKDNWHASVKGVPFRDIFYASVTSVPFRSTRYASVTSVTVKDT